MRSQTPQHYVPMAVGNYQFGKTLRTLFSYVPIILLIMRWLVFWILDSALGQFYNDPDGRKAREERAAYSQKYVEDNAPGMVHHGITLHRLLSHDIREILAFTHTHT